MNNVYYLNANIKCFDIIGFSGKSSYSKNIKLLQAYDIKKNNYDIDIDDMISHVGYIITSEYLNHNSKCSDKKCKKECLKMDKNELYIVEALRSESKEIKDIYDMKDGVVIRKFSDVIKKYNGKIILMKWYNHKIDLNKEL